MGIARDKLLKDLRELYRQGRYQDMKNSFRLGKWILNAEDREKISKVITDKLVSENFIKIGKELGWKEVD